MKLSEFRAALQRHPDHQLCFVLPDGGRIPEQAHITEAGRIDKTFIDCGGTIRSSSVGALQAWTGNDAEHRLAPGKLDKILAMAEPLFRGEDLEMEIEYEDDLISQFPVSGASVSDDILYFHLTTRHTDCLAKEKCLPRESEGGTACCAGSGCCA